MFDNDDAWLILFLLLYSAQNNEFNVHNMFDQEKADAQYVNNCPSVEWEQDMHANIPFCKLDGEMCNMQCKNRNYYNSFNAEKSDIIFNGGVFNDKRREETDLGA